MDHVTNYCRFFIPLLLVCVISQAGYAQDSIPPAKDSTVADSICVQRDLPDLIRRWRGKSEPKKTKSGSLLLFPVVGSNPATGFMYGVAGQYAFQKPGANYSTVVGNATYTTKDQFMLQIKNNIYLKNNKIFLTGDWRLFFFSQSTFGLSTNAPESGILKYQYNINGSETNDDSLVQPMKFDHIRFHQSVSFRLNGGLMAGVGYQYDVYTNIDDQRLRLDTAQPLYTSHYTYSRAYGFDPKKYIVNGITVNLLYDTRDNLVNAYKGYFAMFNFRLSPEFLGNAHGGSTINLEYRSFHGLSKRNPRHLMAFWFMGNFSGSGDLPYLSLPALGYDQRGRAGRGYVQGRFRGPSMMYGEAEYRFPISPCGGIFGGVLFANLTTANSPENKIGLMEYIAPGYGFGFRLMADKKSRTNLQVDFGFGQKSFGVYFGASETF